MIWYLLICSMIGGLSVSVTTGLGSAIVTTFMGNNQVGSLEARRMRYRADSLWGSLNTGSYISS